MDSDGSVNVQADPVGVQVDTEAEAEATVVCASALSKTVPKDPNSQTRCDMRKRKAEQVSSVVVSPSPIERALASMLCDDLANQVDDIGVSTAACEKEKETEKGAEEGAEEEGEGEGEGEGEEGGKKKKTRAAYKQPSRSKAAIRAARVKAKKHERMVENGLCNPPKRNKPFRLNVTKLRMKKLGPFWYSLDPQSCYYMSFEDYQVLKEILEFYKDPANIEKFHRARSNCNLRYYLNFHILHCRQSRVLGTLDPFMTDFANEYLAYQRRYTRQWFCEFNRGPRMLVFEAPQYIQDDLAKKEAAYEDCESSDSETEGDGGEGEGEEGEEGDEGEEDHVPVVLCVAARQLNYFHWIFTTGKYEIMCEREPKLHPSMNEFVKGHKERKTRLHLTTRQKLCVATPGPVIVDHTDTFTMKL